MSRLMRSVSVSIVALFVAVLFICSFAVAAEEAKTQRNLRSKDWTDKQLQDFSKKPWTQIM